MWEATTKYLILTNKHLVGYIRKAQTTTVQILYAKAELFGGVFRKYVVAVRALNSSREARTTNVRFAELFTSTNTLQRKADKPHARRDHDLLARPF